jgi:uncharacterized protein (DUF2344 family)
MGRPAGHKAHTAFYTKPIQDLNREVVVDHIKGTAALTGRENRRLNLQLAADVMGDRSVSKDTSNPSKNTRLEFSVVKDQHDISSLLSEKKNYRINLISEKLVQLKQLKEFLRELENDYNSDFTSTIEKTKAQTVALSKKIPDYANAEELEDEDDLVLRQFKQPVQSTHATPNSLSL